MKQFNCKCELYLSHWIITGVINKHTPIEQSAVNKGYNYNPYYIRTKCNICGYDNINFNTIENEYIRYIIKIKSSY